MFEEVVKINKNRRGKECFSGTILFCIYCILTGFLLQFYFLVSRATWWLTPSFQQSVFWNKII